MKLTYQYKSEGKAKRNHVDESVFNDAAKKLKDYKLVKNMTKT
jgi:hypothetical protein